MKLADLTSVSQTHDESDLDYFKRFKDIKTGVSICQFQKEILLTLLLTVYVRILEKS